MLIFDLLYFIALLLSLPLWVTTFFKKEYREILFHRLSPAISGTSRKRLWIHAVSVGEVRSLTNLLQRLKETYKGTEIVLTVTTPSGYRCAKQLYTDITVLNAPMDFSFTIRRFIKKINPQVLILNELEIWPNWVTITHKKKIPILLINGRMSEHAFRRYKKTNFFLQYFFKKIDHYLLQAELYRERFTELKIPEEKITVCGNIKADQAFDSIERLRPRGEILDYLGVTPDSRQIVTLASSHPTDEELVIPAIPRTSDDFFFIIVPRHLDRVGEIEKRLLKHGVNFTTWSKRKKAGSNTNSTGKTGDNKDVLLFDQMGYLYNVLKISDIVFMGGTLTSKIGGHNLYEPAALGKCIMGGPHYNNFPEIGRQLINNGVYHVMEDTSRCLEWLKNWDNQDKDAIKKEAVNTVTAMRGSIQCTLKEIHRYMETH
jgi:3-deoxy-D-manno-octulosonic-acid transferase